MPGLAFAAASRLAGSALVMLCGFRPLLGSRDPGGNERRAQNRERGNGLGQENPCRNDGDEGIEINEIVGSNDAQKPEGLVLQHIAEPASDQAQEEEVAEDYRLCQRRGGKGRTLQQYRHDGGGGAPKQGSVGDKNGIKPLTGLSEQNGVYRPAGRGTQSQQIAPGIQLQDKRAVANRQNYAGKGREEAPQRVFPESFHTGEMSRDCGEDGRCGHNNADIGGHGIGQSGILRVKIGRAAGEAQQKKDGLLFSCQAKTPGPQKPQHAIGQQKTDQHNLRGRVNRQQFFAGNEGRAPYGDGKSGKEATGELFTVFMEFVPSSKILTLGGRSGLNPILNLTAVMITRARKKGKRREPGPIFEILEKEGWLW